MTEQKDHGGCLPPPRPLALVMAIWWVAIVGVMLHFPTFNEWTVYVMVCAFCYCLGFIAGTFKGRQ